MQPQISRRQFISYAGAAGFATFLPFKSSALSRKDETIFGHGSHRYRMVPGWGILDSTITPVKDCHEMVQDSKGRLVLLTNEVKNNVIFYDKSGKLLKTWTNNWIGAHGLTLHKEGGEDILYITDPELHQVYKTTIDGRILMTLNYPDESGKYSAAEKYKPTETAIAPNGDIYVADGYGEQYITQYNHKGEFIRCFGGPGEGEDQFKQAHGIALDTRNKKNPTLLITERKGNCFRRFTLDGKHLETVHTPGAYICRPVIDGENIYFAALRSIIGDVRETGFVTILDGQNKVISNPGGNDPVYVDGKLNRIGHVGNTFTHPHDVCVDEDKNIYIPQWNSGKTYPIKLERI